VGATFFIASSLLFMLEEQPAWWRPKPGRIGWHVGFWNLVGSGAPWLGPRELFPATRGPKHGSTHPSPRPKPNRPCTPTPTPPPTPDPPVGFWLCGFFGFWEPNRTLQTGGTAASTFWGSYAFLIGSYLQLLEAVNKDQAALVPAGARARGAARAAAEAAAAEAAAAARGAPAARV
jgi:hypothetical protein